MNYQSIQEKHLNKTNEGYFELYKDNGILYMYKQYDDQFFIYKFDEHKQKEDSVNLFFNEIEYLHGLINEAMK